MPRPMGSLNRAPVRREMVARALELHRVGEKLDYIGSVLGITAQGAHYLVNRWQDWQPGTEADDE